MEDYSRDSGSHYELDIRVEDLLDRELDNVWVEIVSGDPSKGGISLEKYCVSSRDNSTRLNYELDNAENKTVYIYVDLDNLVAEENEENNVCAVSF